MKKILEALTKWAGYALTVAGIVAMVPEILQSLAALLGAAGAADIKAMVAAAIALASGLGLLLRKIQQENAETARAMAVIARARALNELPRSDARSMDGEFSAAVQAVRELEL